MFKEVAKNFENNIEDPSKYHRELLRKMNLDVYQIRPKLISDEGFTILDEIRKFRHIFRHGYEYELDGKRIVELSNMLISNWEVIANDKDSFRQFLVAMVGSQ